MKSSIQLVLVIVLACAMRAVNANSLMVVDGAGRAIGYYPGNGYCINGDVLPVYSKQSYLACIRIPNGMIEGGLISPGGGSVGGTMEFISTDCSGQSYAYGLQYGGGYVMRASTVTSNGILMMIPKGVSSTTQTANSELGLSGFPCQTFSSPQTAQMSLSVPSVPLVSGFSLSPYAPPLHVEIMPDSSLDDVIFFDGFEGY